MYRMFVTLRSKYREWLMRFCPDFSSDPWLLRTVLLNFQTHANVLVGSSLLFSEPTMLWQGNILQRMSVLRGLLWSNLWPGLWRVVAHPARVLIRGTRSTAVRWIPLPCQLDQVVSHIVLTFCIQILQCVLFLVSLRVLCENCGFEYLCLLIFSTLTLYIWSCGIHA